ncbi:hypothetical protein AERO8C_20212 [Aeromonas veronii]|uniref:Uncharacterized protein n=1 Tax=Aeromonas veronii TaxID=654 RepID=A0A653L2B8_AERVE|nr:hypothetical protein AERO8C_20212 [Aeromonas veronii]
MYPLPGYSHAKKKITLDEMLRLQRRFREKTCQS